MEHPASVGAKSPSHLGRARRPPLDIPSSVRGWLHCMRRGARALTAYEREYMARLDLRMPEGDTIARLPSVDGGEGYCSRVKAQENLP